VVKTSQAPAPDAAVVSRAYVKSEHMQSFNMSLPAGDTVPVGQLPTVTAVVTAVGAVCVQNLFTEQD